MFVYEEQVSRLKRHRTYQLNSKDVAMFSFEADAKYIEIH